MLGFIYFFANFPPDEPKLFDTGTKANEDNTSSRYVSIKISTRMDEEIAEKENK